MNEDFKFIVHEGRIHGARYITVHPHTMWWHDEFSSYWDKWHNWCTENFGNVPDDGVWSPGGRWYANNGKFWFRKEADATAFLLRWDNVYSN